MSDPAMKLFGKTIPLPELVCVDSSSSYTEHQHQNPVRLSDSCTGDDEEMGDSGLAGDDVWFHGGDSESEKVMSFWILGYIFKNTHDRFVDVKQFHSVLIPWRWFLLFPQMGLPVQSLAFVVPFFGLMFV